MAKYLVKARYTQEGVKGLLKEGGTGRRGAIEKVLTGMGGSLEAFYYVFGDDDALLIVSLPDNASAAALSLTVGAAGGATCTTHVLLTPEELDAAGKTSVDYRAPGR